MRIVRKKPHWAVELALGLLMMTGCKATQPGEMQAGATGIMAKPAATTATMNGAAGASAKSTGSASATSIGAASSAMAAAGSGTAATPESAAAMSGAEAGAASATPMKAKNPNAIPACEGKNNEGACDGSKLYFCIDEAPDGPGMTCMSAALCQVGIKSGKCGMCESGTFHCEATDLQKCDENGQWMLDSTCASEALCKEAKGICDDVVCTAGEYKCKGDALVVCNDQLTDFKMEMTCEKGLCNAAGKKCNECDPIKPKVCDSMSQLTTCDATGMKKTDSCPSATPHCIADKNECFECVTTKDCGESKNECGTLACTDNKCVAGDPKPLQTKCSTGVCDIAGTCVACITDDDCHDAQKACLTGIGCVNKIPLTAVADLFGSGYQVTISAGYDATVSGGSPEGVKHGSATADTTFPVTVPGGLSSQGCFGSILAGSSLSLQFGTPSQLVDGGFTPGCAMPNPTVTVSSDRMH
jgi:hypothetical protein